MTDEMTTEVIGFRQWRVTEDLELRSGHMDDVWTPGEMRAECKGREDFNSYHYGNGANAFQVCPDCPSSRCHCGLYGLHAPTFWYGPDADADARRRNPFHMMLHSHAFYVAGLISAWGKMQVHADGFRAQYAKVVAIAVPARPRDAVLARAVAAKYGVATVPQAELERVASEFGSLVPEALRPEKVKYVDPYAAYIGFVQQALGGRKPGRASTYATYQHSIGIHTAPQPTPPAPPPKTKYQTIADEINRMKSETYDPRAFLPKRREDYCPTCEEFDIDPVNEPGEA